MSFQKTVFDTNAKVKEAAKSSGPKPSQIIRNAIVDCVETSRVYLPGASAQKQSLKAETLEEIEIPEELKFLEGDLFVLAMVKKVFG